MSDCSICLQPKTSKQAISSLISCPHKFHSHCIKRWLRFTENSTCPMCRDVTSIEDVDDTDWIPPADYNHNNIKTNGRKSKRIQRKLKWKTKKYIYECSQCMKTFKTEIALMKHETMHNQERAEPYNYKCGHCDYYDLFKDTFKTHNIVEHGECKPYQCQRCKKQFKHSPNLNKHIYSTHWKRKKYKCNVCDAAYYLKADLKRHTRTHLPNNTFQCNECRRGFKLKSNLIKHYAVHSSERPFECDICNKKFKLQQHLRQHQATHSSERPFKCGICERRFKHNRNLRQHQSVHVSTAIG